MIRVGGNSYNNGIQFTGEKYLVRFEQKQGKTEFVVKQNIVNETSKFMRFIKRIPLIRGFINVICKNKELLIIIIIDIVMNLITLNKEAPADSISEGLIITLMILLFLTVLLTVAMIVHVVVKTTVNMKYTWMYHGAEHKVIAANYAGKEITLENCRAMSRISDNCGTMLVSLMIFVYIILFILQIVLKIPLWSSVELILMITISYELFLMKRTNIVLKPAFKLGYFLQEHCFTKEPNDHQLAQAMLAFSILEALELGELTIDEVNEVFNEANLND